MPDTKDVTVVPTETSGPPKFVPVIIEVINGTLKCTPEHVPIFGGEQVQWNYNRAGGLKIEFKADRPFGHLRHDMEGMTLLSGDHDCKAERELFKYTITVPDPNVAPLDPVVDADPRKRPTIK